MHSTIPIAALLLAGSVLLAAAALHDLGFRTVPNAIPLALLFCGLVLRGLSGDILWGVGTGLLVFALAVAAWRFGWMGGGDVKLLGAAAVFVPPLLVPTLVLATSLAGGVLAMIYLLGPFVAPRPRSGPIPRRGAGLLRRAGRCELWRWRRRGPLPYAAAIAAGGLIAAGPQFAPLLASLGH